MDTPETSPSLSRALDLQIKILVAWSEKQAIDPEPDIKLLASAAQCTYRLLTAQKIARDLGAIAAPSLFDDPAERAALIEAMEHVDEDDYDEDEVEADWQEAQRRGNEL